MPHRRVMERAVFAAVMLLAAGCHGRVEPVAPPTADRPTPAGPVAVAQQADASPSLPVKPTVRITPEAFTITADDPGLQLLAADETDSARDRTAEVRWTAEPSGLVTIEAGGYLRPIASGVVTVRAAMAKAGTGELSAEAKVTIEPRSARPWDFGEDIVPILTRLGCNTGACQDRKSVV